MFKILVEKDLQDDNLGELTSIVEHKWDRFLKDDLPAINEALLAQPWMAQATGGTDPVQG